jgi:hypothetical protein
VSGRPWREGLGFNSMYVLGFCADEQIITQHLYGSMMTDLLNANTYVIKKKLLKILGEEFHIYIDDQDVLIGYSEQKALKIKEDIRVFSDKSKSNKILNIKQRNVIDAYGRFDFTDPNTGESLGGIRRNWGKSWFRDSYSIYGPDDQVYGEVKEDSLMNAMLRRAVPFLGTWYWCPDFSMNVQGQPSITFQTYKEWLGFGRQTLEVHIPDENQLDRRVILGAAMIMIAIEGDQNEGTGFHDLPLIP